MALLVRDISPGAHRRFLADRAGVSYLQRPEWAPVWGGDSFSVGWFDEQSTAVGVGLVLTRKVKSTPYRLAYLPEGPVLDWGIRPTAEVLAPLIEHVRRRSIISVRIAPLVSTARWRAGTVRDAIRHGTAAHLDDLPPDEVDHRGGQLASDLAAGGWTATPHEAVTGWPRHSWGHSMELRLGGRAAEEIWHAFAGQRRRQIRRAEEAGIEVAVGGPAQLGEFHELYKSSAGRQGFAAMPAARLDRLHRELSDPGQVSTQLVLARSDGVAIAGMLNARVGTRLWGVLRGAAPSVAGLHPSALLDWWVIRDGLAHGVDVLDMRWVEGGLASSSPGFGQLWFKLMTGADVVAYVGEWVYPVNRAVSRVFDLHLARRQRHRLGAEPAPLPV